MGFKKITDSGIQLITETCKNKSNLFVSTHKFQLPKSNAANNAVYTAVIKDGDIDVDSAEKYATYIIKYINKYSEVFLLDANIIAAQIYVESGFSPVSYKKNNTLGVCGLTDYEFVKYLFDDSDSLTSTDVNKFKLNISGDSSTIKTYIPYLNINQDDLDEKINKTKSNQKDNELAAYNRPIMFQNIIDNPYLSIYVQCILISLYGSKNNNLASSSLLNYYLRSQESSGSYVELMNKNNKIYGNIDIALKYVEDTLKVLAGKYPNLGYGFGKDYDVNFQDYLQLDDRKINPRANEPYNKVTREVLLASLPRIPKSNIDIYLTTLNNNIEKFEINTRVRLAHFFSQIGHESGDLTILTESLNYSANQLTKINPFSKYFKNVSDTVGFVGNPEKIANLGYGGRKDLGNNTTGDGYKFRGRGAIQNTGRLKYTTLSQQMNIDLINNPDLLTQPTNAMVAAFWEWKTRNLNKYADQDDVLKVTKRINGGTNGIDDRIIRLRRSKIALEIA